MRLLRIRDLYTHDRRITSAGHFRIILRTSNFNLFAVCVAIWGTTWWAITYQFGTVAPEISVGIRFVFASLVLFAVCAVRKIPLKYTGRQHIDFVLMGAFMFCVSYIFVYYAEMYIVSGMVAIAYSASPMLNMLMSRAMFGTRMTQSAAIGSMLGIVGIVFVFWPELGKLSSGRSTELGIIFTVLSVVASAFGSMTGVRVLRHGYPVWSSMAWGMLYGGMLTLLIALVSGKSFALSGSFSYWAAMAYLSIAGSIITFACYLTLIKRVGAAPASYVGVMAPIVALAVSFFFEKFDWGWMTTIGVALSVAGNVVILRGKAQADNR